MLHVPILALRSRSPDLDHTEVTGRSMALHRCAPCPLARRIAVCYPLGTENPGGVSAPRRTSAWTPSGPGCGDAFPCGPATSAGRTQGLPTSGTARPWSPLSMYEDQAII